MSRRSWIAAIAAAVLLGLALLWAFMPQPVAVEVAAVTQGRFETTIDEDGKTRLADRYVVAAALAGRLARIGLREGDPVEAGMTVATLTPVLPALQDERARRELRARVEAAEDNVARAAARVQRVQVALAQARTEQRRSEELSQQGFIAPTKLDADRLATEAAQRELDTAAAEQRIAGHDLEQARAALGAAQPGAAARPFEVRSPIGGRVMRVLQQSETVVALGTPLIELGDTHPHAQWQALGDGFRVGVRIVTVAQEEALQVPVSAVFPLPADGAGLGPDAAADPPTHAVFVVEGGLARQVPVRLGGRNGSAAWIRSGLALGTSVIVYPPATVRDGVRVRVRGS